MRYLILGKDDLKGIPGSDSAKDGDINRYWELGWESVGGRIDFISFYNQGFWDQDNMTAVAIEDRMFLYTKMCKNVISYTEFKKLNVSREQIIFDIPANHMSCCFTKKSIFLKPGTIEYYRKKEDQELIFNGRRIKNKNCARLITQATGLVALALTCAETDIELIDQSKCSRLDSSDAILGGKCIHFFKGEVTPYFYADDKTCQEIISKTIKK